MVSGDDGDVDVEASAIGGTITMLTRFNWDTLAAHLIEHMKYRLWLVQ